MHIPWKWPLNPAWWFFATPLKNMSSSVGIIIPNIWGKKKVPNHQAESHIPWYGYMDIFPNPMMIPVPTCPKWCKKSGLVPWTPARYGSRCEPNGCKERCVPQMMQSTSLKRMESLGDSAKPCEGDHQQRSPFWGWSSFSGVSHLEEPPGWIHN